MSTIESQPLFSRPSRAAGTSIHGSPASDYGIWADARPNPIGVLDMILCLLAIRGASSRGRQKSGRREGAARDEPAALDDPSVVMSGLSDRVLNSRGGLTLSNPATTKLPNKCVPGARLGRGRSCVQQSTGPHRSLEAQCVPSLAHSQAP